MGLNGLDGRGLVYMRVLMEEGGKRVRCIALALRCVLGLFWVGCLGYRNPSRLEQKLTVGSHPCTRNTMNRNV